MTANAVPQGVFGPGLLILQRNDTSGFPPVNVGKVNEFSVDITYETKNLYGENQFALLSARGTAKISGKIKAALLSGQAINQLLLGGTWTAGTQYDVATQASTAIPATPFQLTVTPPSSGTWYADLGVVNAATLVPLSPVASSPGAGQYSVAAGVYTFSSADHTSGISVIINYAYSFTTGATGQNQVLVNTPIGTTPTFQLWYKTALYGSTYLLSLYQCICSKVALAHKLTDFMMPEYDFEAYANTSGNVGLISLATQA